MDGKFIKIRQFHIVTVEVAQMGIGIVGHRQLMAFLMSFSIDMSLMLTNS